MLEGFPLVEVLDFWLDELVSSPMGPLPLVASLPPVEPLPPVESLPPVEPLPDV